MNAHAHIEALAGAIALGEAGESERAEYRAHIAACPRCLENFGGEREIERVAASIAQARDGEMWSPDLRGALALRIRRRGRSFRYGAGVLGGAVAISLAVHFFILGGLSSTLPLRGAPGAVAYSGATRVVLEAPARTVRGAAPAAQSAPAIRRTYVAQHNVVIMQRAVVNAAPAPPPAPPKDSAPRQIAAIVVHPDVGLASAPGSAKRAPSWHTVATSTTTSLIETAPQSFTHNAESLQFAPRYSRDASPVGGETAIDPRPPMIAYDEGAEGTSAFEVLVDERGNPTRCVITKPSGWAVLDATVCKAAMGTKYYPKVQNGRAVAGVYRDAFTFRMQDDQSVEGIPQENRPPDYRAPHPGQTPPPQR